MRSGWEGRVEKTFLPAAACFASVFPRTACGGGPVWSGHPIRCPGTAYQCGMCYEGLSVIQRFLSIVPHSGSMITDFRDFQDRKLKAMAQNGKKQLLRSASGRHRVMKHQKAGGDLVRELMLDFDESEGRAWQASFPTSRAPMGIARSLMMSHQGLGMLVCLRTDETPRTLRAFAEW
eukprot:1153915-Pelagomonas_calceolata.AAC.1